MAVIIVVIVFYLTGGRGYAFPGNCGGNLLLLGVLYDL